MKTSHHPTAALRLGVAGLGTIGLAVARRVAARTVPGMVLVAVSARDHAKAKQLLQQFGASAKVVPLEELAEDSDIIVECAPAAVFLDIATPAIEAARVFMPLSVGALLKHPELIDRAAQTGARIMVPTGALLGLDAVRAVAEGEIESVRLVTRKPPAGLRGAPFLVANGISVEGLQEPLKVFTGSAHEAATGFPANVNVAAALALAGVGPERTLVEIWADPDVTRNTHTVTVESDSSRINMTIENIPTPENPPTGKVTALSTIAALKRLTQPLVIGT